MNTVNPTSATRCRRFDRLMGKTLLIAFCCIWCMSALAQVTKTWVGSNNGSWNNASNWSPSGVPGTNDSVVILSNHTITSSWAANATISIRALTITGESGTCNLLSNAGTGNFSTLEVTSTLTVAANKILAIGLSDAGRLNLTLTSAGKGNIDGTVFINSYTGNASGNYDRIFTNNGNLTISASGLINGQFSIANNRGAGFILNSGATLQIANVLGIEGGTGAGANGAVQTYVRTFNSGANYIYNGTSNQVTGNGLTANQPANVTINNPGNTVTLSGNRTISGNLSILAGTYDLGTFTMNRSASGGTFSMAAGTFLLLGSNNFPGSFTTNTLNSTSTVNYYAAGAQNIAAVTYGNLVLSGSGTKTLTSGGTTINNTLTIGEGTTLDVAAIQPTIQGGASVIVNGILDFTNSSGFMRTGTSGTSTLTIGSNGLLRTFDQDGIGPAANASLQIQTGGSWNVASISTNGTVEYYRNTTSAQNVTDRDYNNLIITGTSQTKTWTLSGDRVINGALTINGNFTLSGGQTISIKGNWARNSGSFNAGGSTILFNGAPDQSIGGTLATTFYNLAIATGSVVNLGTLAHTSTTLTMGGFGRAAGVWGHPSSGAQFQNSTFFANNTGTVTVASSTCTAPNFSILVTNASCFGANDGSIKVTVNSGLPGYEFSKDGGNTWTSPQSENEYTFSNLNVAGNPYNIRVRDASGCVQMNCN